MAVTRYTLSGNPQTQIGTAFDGKVEVLIESSVNPLIDTSANVEQLGTVSIMLDTGGAWSASLIGTTSSDVNAAPQYQVTYSYIDAATRQRTTWESGWFNLTANSNLADLATSTTPIVRLSEGSGSPESVVTASVGATYVDTAATRGAIRWVKATGSGNTGWVVEYGDTGWRNITATQTWPWATTTLVRLRRIGQQVTLWVQAAEAGAESATAVAGAIPTGFRPSNTLVIEEMNRAVGDETQRVAVLSSGDLQLTKAATTGSTAYLNMRWLTDDAWPTSLPGT